MNRQAQVTEARPQLVAPFAELRTALPEQHEIVNVADVSALGRKIVAPPSRTGGEIKTRSQYNTIDGVRAAQGISSANVVNCGD